MSHVVPLHEPSSFVAAGLKLFAVTSVQPHITGLAPSITILSTQTLSPYKGL